MQTTTELILIRHGESEANAGLSNDPDCGLTPRGLEQARDVARKLAGQDLDGFAAVCSPYRRAVRTAQAISEACRLEFAIEPAVREWGATATVDGAHYPTEPIGDVIGRLRVFLETVRGQRLVIVSHAAPIAVLTQLLWGEEPMVEGQFWRGVGNCCVRWVKGIC